VNPYVFVVGCPRSGTTLVKRMLEMLPELAITGETHWITIPFKGKQALATDRKATPQQIDRISAHRGFAKLALPQDEADRILGASMVYSEMVSEIFDVYGRVRGKPLVGDKTPSYARFVRELHDQWPNAKFIHIIRDGRDVCLSLLNWKKAEHAAGRFATWNEDRLTTSALRWDWNVRLAREAAATLPAGLYHEVRYESLVADPERQARYICDFLGLAYKPLMLRFHEAHTRTDPRLDAKNAWLPVTQGLRDWRTQMEPSDVEKCEAAAGDLLQQLGYERLILEPSRSTSDHVALIKRMFSKDALERERPLPQAWQT
jgi:hypothetical protein